MNRFLAWFVLKGAARGFKLDWDDVERAKQAHAHCK
jgi:hypothetical protein